MKKTYQTPGLTVERFSLTQNITACSGIRINSTSNLCVLADPDATMGMRDFAAANYFLGGGAGCTNVVGDGDAGLCYFTSSNMAFTS